MKSNSPFDWHNIDHLSVSTINAWIADPAQILYKFSGGQDDYGPSAWRGNACESAFYQVAMEDAPSPLKTIHTIAEQEYDKLDSGGFAQAKVEKERGYLPSYINAGIEHFRQLGVPSSYQRKIYVEFEELEVPFIGYVDFEYGELGKSHQIRDCKTSVRRMTHLTNAHCRQLALFGHAIGDEKTELWIDSVSKTEIIKLRLSNPKPYLREVIKTALGLRKFLSMSSDLEELRSMIRPDLDDWRWGNENTQKQAKKIWEIKYE